MNTDDVPDVGEGGLIELVAEVVSAYVSNNPVPVSELPNLIGSIHAALERLHAPPAQAAVEKPRPAVNPKKSVHNDYLICLEDGKKFKSLKRHLMTHYGLSPEAYREKWKSRRRLSDGGTRLCGSAIEVGQIHGFGSKAKVGSYQREWEVALSSAIFVTLRMPGELETKLCVTSAGWGSEARSTDRYIGTVDGDPPSRTRSIRRA